MDETAVSETGRVSVRRPTEPRAFRALALRMVGLGLVMGVLFPFLVLPLGVDPQAALRPRFFLATIGAGLVVGGANFALVRLVVGRRLRELTASMAQVARSIREATFAAGSEDYRAQDARLTVDSDDDFGAAALSFNELLRALDRSRMVELALDRYSRALVRVLDLDTFAGVALQGAIDHAGAAGGVLLAFDGDDSTVLASRALDPALADPALADPAVLEALWLPVGVDGHGGPIRTSAPGTDAGAHGQPPLAELIWLPLRSAEVTSALLVLAYREPPRPEHLRILELLRDITTVALDNALTHQQLERFATIDPLTRCHNRRSGLLRLDEEFDRATRYGTRLGLLALDIDHFKRVNDTYGHAAGDRVLAATAAVVVNELRSSDVLVRTGGEEFVVLLPDASSDEVASIGERVRGVVAATPHPVAGAQHHVTVSLGGLSYPAASAQRPDDLLAAVDKALYRSKHDGRDRLTMV